MYVCVCVYIYIYKSNFGGVVESEISVSPGLRQT